MQRTFPSAIDRIASTCSRFTGCRLVMKKNDSVSRWHRVQRRLGSSESDFSHRGRCTEWQSRHVTNDSSWAVKCQLWRRISRSSAWQERHRRLIVRRSRRAGFTIHSSDPSACSLPGPWQPSHPRRSAGIEPS
jgi:hypothetical protein